jgi:ribosomal protein L34E
MSSIVSVDEILGCPTTPQSLDDFSVSSPSSFMSSRHASPCGSYMSSETSPSSVASPPPEDVKIKSEPEVKVKTEPEQKPVKKRKSWGQQLPTPTTNLPPRYVKTQSVTAVRTELLTDFTPGNALRPPRKRNNAALSECSVTGPPLRNLAKLRSNNWRRSNRNGTC